jgi:hypothetical protein
MMLDSTKYPILPFFDIILLVVHRGKIKDMLGHPEQKRRGRSAC